MDKLLDEVARLLSNYELKNKERLECRVVSLDACRAYHYNGAFFESKEEVCEIAEKNQSVSELSVR